MHREAVSAASVSTDQKAHWQRYVDHVRAVDDATPLVKVKFGQSEAVVCADGNVFDSQGIKDMLRDEEIPSEDKDVLRRNLRLAWAMDGFLEPDVTTVNERLLRFLPGAAWGNKKLGDVVVPSGVFAVIAGSNKGKTPFVKALASHNSTAYDFIRFGEPFSGYSTDFERGAQMLGQAIVGRPEDTPDTVIGDVVLDSVKDVASGEGGRMASGFSRAVLLSASHWSSLFCSVGKTLYVPVNPSTPDKDVLDMVIEALTSSVTAAAFPSETSPDRWDVIIRPGEGMERIRTEVVFNRSGELRVKAQRTISSQATVDLVTLALASMSTATRRLLSR